MFDLPVTTKKQARIAAKFRNSLLDEGFQMSQFSVYMKFCGNREAAETLTKKVMDFSPEAGTITILSITDKQYANIKVVRSHAGDPADSPRNQLLLL